VKKLSVRQSLQVGHSLLRDNNVVPKRGQSLWEILLDDQSNVSFDHVSTLCSFQNCKDFHNVFVWVAFWLSIRLGFVLLGHLDCVQRWLSVVLGHLHCVQRWLSVCLFSVTWWSVYGEVESDLDDQLASFSSLRCWLGHLTCKSCPS